MLLLVCYINNNVISIVYAYPIEVKVLKAFVKKNNFKMQIRWHRWPLIPKQSRELVLNVGFAGGLNSSLALGQVVLIERIMAFNKNGLDEFVINNSQQRLAVNFAKNNNLALASLLTVSNPVTDVLLRDELRQKTRADIVDMEGYNLYSATKDMDLPVVSFKIITDNADSDTWLNIKQKSELWSKILAKEVVGFLLYLFGQAKLAREKDRNGNTFK